MIFSDQFFSFPQRLYAVFQGRISYLGEDFIGISLNIKAVGIFVLQALIAFACIAIIFLIGNKIRQRFFLEEGDKNVFLSIAFGYITVGTGIVLLGIYSLLAPTYLVLYIIVICVIALHELNSNSTKIFLAGFFRNPAPIKKNKAMSIFILLFFIVGFLRLLLPETGVDALWYHTDYPKQYLQRGTMMVPVHGNLYLAATPQLGQMPYVIFTFLGLVDSARIFHFLFLILVLVLLYHISKDLTSPNAGLVIALLFITSPIILRHAPTAYVDFQWLFFWLLSLWILLKAKILRLKIIILTGVLFGGLLSMKLLAIVFFPVLLMYILLKSKGGSFSALKNVLLFLFTAGAVVSIWYVRAFVMTGNPFYPQFASMQNELVSVLTLNDFLSLAYWQYKVQGVFNILDFSFLSAVALVGLFFLQKNQHQMLVRSNLFTFFCLVALLFFFLPTPFFVGRHLLYLYSLIILLFALPLANIYERFILARRGIQLALLLLFSYYFIGTLVLLPYGFGWADTNKYLTRTLENDNSSYYDYDRKFSKYIGKNETVVTYKVQGLYYASFEPKDVALLLEERGNIYTQLEKYNISKLLIKGGDIRWFCSNTKYQACDVKNFVLLAKHEPAKLYLYKINE